MFSKFFSNLLMQQCLTVSKFESEQSESENDLVNSDAHELFEFLLE